jgi:hypothetical protein
MEFTDPASRLEALVASVEPKFRARFLAVIRSIKDQRSLEDISALILAGQIDEALLTAEVAALRLSNLFNQVVILSGSETAASIGGNLNILVEFDHVNQHALSAMTRNRLRMVTEFMAEQREATRAALIDGIQRGANPIEQARAFRDSIGLTRYQQEIVNNYRRNLNELSPRALDRELRDRRFDRTVNRAIRDGVPLRQDQIDNMVSRYTDRWVKYRSEVIARTESLRSVHLGNDEMYRQAIADGHLSQGDLIRTWDTSKLGNVRDSHKDMEGQQRGIGEMFTSGLGNALEFPGDDRAPVEDTAQCVCAVTTRYTSAAREAILAAIPTAQPL